MFVPLNVPPWSMVQGMNQVIVSSSVSYLIQKRANLPMLKCCLLLMERLLELIHVRACIHSEASGCCVAFWLLFVAIRDNTQWNGVKSAAHIKAPSRKGQISLCFKLRVSLWSFDVRFALNPVRLSVLVANFTYIYTSYVAVSLGLLQPLNTKVLICINYETMPWQYTVAHESFGLNASENTVHLTGVFSFDEPKGNSEMSEYASALRTFTT
ncbi:hypothetical protein CBL_07315 [Carabus blaptoides fortunei]